MGQNLVHTYLTLTISFLISVVICYILSCLIFLAWNKIFRYFGERAKLYKRIAGIFLLFLFVFIVIVLPVIGTYFVTLEKNTYLTMGTDEPHINGIKLQEIVVRNNFILPINYKLPDVTVCLHDIEGSLTLGYSVGYRTEDGEFVEDMDKFRRNVITIKPLSEIKIYLQEFLGILGKGNEKFVYKERERYNELLLLTNVGMDNYNYCYGAKESDTLNSEKIKLLKVKQQEKPNKELCQITRNAAQEGRPAIYGDKIIWGSYKNGRFDIYVYDLSIGQKTRVRSSVTQYAPTQYFHDVYGDKIVWKDMRNDNWDVYMHDLSTGQETRITTEPADQSSPAIYGDKIVWHDIRNGNTDIYMYDLSTDQETQITTNTADQSKPAIYGDKIVWKDNRNGNFDIYMYDLSTNQETQITTNTQSQLSPNIYKNKIVWYDYRNNTGSIYMYDLTTNQETKLTTDLSTREYHKNEKDTLPIIYENKIVWHDYRNGNADIYMYDMSSGQETQITTNIEHQVSPFIYGDKIVWYDYRERYWAIYMTTTEEIEEGVVCSIETQGIECCTDVDCSVIEVCNISSHFCHIQDPVFIALSEKIGKDDAEFVASLLPIPNFTLTEEFIDEFIVDYSPGYDVDNDLTIIGDSEAPSFLKIAEISLDSFYNNSPEFYQYAIEELRYIRGRNPGSRCGAAQVGGKGMIVNTYNYIYDYKGVPLDEQPPIYSFLFIHEATHIKVRELRQSGKIKQLTTPENEAIAYLAHGYYAKTYDPTGQTVLVTDGGIPLKEFVITWTRIHSNVPELPEDYIWDWDFYVSVLEKAGFPPEELDNLIVELNSSD